MSVIATPVKIRLLSRSKPSQDGCLEWMGSKNSNGYGIITVGSMTNGTRRNVSAHRASYEEWIGPIPEGMVIDHLCRNRACIHPNHLEPVTQKENANRGIWSTRKGRFSGKTHCKNGHPLGLVDTKYNWKGCKICKNEVAKKWQKENKPWRNK